MFPLRLLAADNPGLLNFSSMIGYHGMEFSEASYDIVEHKQVDVWLILRDAAPFMVKKFYPLYAPVFDERVRTAFAANYAHTAAFDLYFAEP